DYECVNAATNHERSRIMSKIANRIVLLAGISPVLFAVGAMAQPIQLHSTLAGNNPKIVIGGVESAGSPWTVKNGLASLDATGKLHVRVRDLILPSTGDAGPVTAVSASLVCGGSGGTVQSETAPVPLSTKETRTFMDTSPCPPSASGPSFWFTSRPAMGIRLPSPAHGSRQQEA